MPDDEGEQRGGILGSDVVRREHHGSEVAADDVFASVDVLARVQRIGTSDALAPAVTGVSANPHEQHLAAGLAPEGRLERTHQWDGETVELDRENPHETGGRSSRPHCCP